MPGTLTFVITLMCQPDDDNNMVVFVVLSLPSFMCVYFYD